MAVIALGAAVSIALVVLAYALILVALGGASLGPINHTGLQIIAVAIWTGAPVAAGLVTRRATREQVMRLAASAGGIVAVLVALFVLFGPRGNQFCDYGWAGAGVGVLAVASVVGAGFGTGAFVTARFSAPGGRIGAIVAACALHFGASLVGYWLLYNVVLCAIDVGG